MTANVISLSVLNGSGGYAVAHQVADQLGYRYYDWEITSEAAARSGVSPSDVIAAERVPGFLERMMVRLGAVSAISEGGAGFADPSPSVWSSALQSLTSDDYRQVVERVVQELADRGDAVIVGHAGQYLLRGRSGVLKVLLHGSEEHRTQRLALEQGIDATRAAVMIKQSDKDRRELLKRLYHFDWLDASVYDLSVNTDHLSVEFAAETIVAAARELP